MEEPRALQKYGRCIDHIAIAVPDLDRATQWYTQALGMVAEEEKQTQGTRSAMRSRVLRAGGLKFVLVQGTNPEAAVCKFIEAFGPGVQHVAVLVDDIEAVVEDLQQHMDFDTNVINAPQLKQAFTHRDAASGMVYELVQRTEYDGFQDDNVHQLWNALENKDAY